MYYLMDEINLNTPLVKIGLLADRSLSKSTIVTVLKTKTIVSKNMV